MRLVFAGTPVTAVPTLEALLAHPVHEVAAVVTRPDRPVGRGRHVQAGPIKETALAAGVEVLQPGRPSDPEFVDRLRAIAPDCCPVVAYGALLPPVVLTVPAHGWVNLHFSLLPAWRGAAPVQHAILAGDQVTGACTFQIEEGLDTGPVFGMLTTDIGGEETAGDLLARLAVDGAGLMVATLDGIADGSLQPRPQQVDGVSIAPKLTVDDARVDWRTPALRIDRQVRACTPAPGAWTTFRDRRLKLGPVRIGDTQGLGPGDLRADGDAIFVGTGSATAVRLGDVQPEGRAAMPAAAWARGLRIQPAERLE